MKKLLLTSSLLALSLPVCAKPKAPVMPTGPATFYFSASVPRYVNSDITFRDPSGVLWPNFFFGRPVDGGTFNFDPQNSQAKFALKLDAMAQDQGKQDRKVLGELCAPGKFPVVTFALNSLGPLAEKTVESGGKTRTIQSATGQGVLTVGERSVPIQPQITLSFYSSEKGGAGVMVNGRFSIKGSDLGLKTNADKPISVSVTGFATPKAPR